MLIVCPSCTTAYRIELSVLGASGRLVRCVRCRTVWFASTDNVMSASAEPSLAAASTEPPRPADDNKPADRARASDQPRQDQTADNEHAGPGDDETDASAPDSASHSRVVADAPGLVPSMAPETRMPGDPPAGPTKGDDIESLAARRERTVKPPPRLRFDAGRMVQGLRVPALRMPGLPAPGLPGAIVMMCVVVMALANWRVAVVRELPQTASLFGALGLPVNLRGLDFDDVKASTEFEGDTMVLAVEGSIGNVTTETVSVPRLRFALRNGAGQEIYAWTALPARNSLAPGERLPFRSRLAFPPADGRDVIVRFFNRRDLVAGQEPSSPDQKPDKDHGENPDR
jgi:predicted Zn finger-like uncharacterized protein